ncbi:Putative esterase/lipase ybfF [Methylophaga frappieri]|uniref:Putative esterase/lipase ybfF n=1 Tax=Methylophaga frappieri (strain ATCC BAA-2434 / DSM 25690 / JAM7) TaxID=754477 RepID=I1YG25_METFJ|nr:alpha/beta fold hydrolase [Methylophaga frappieri]AFJ01868.1 Putative esterase/lipase ybfF [Methylophaga frappieri]
MALYYQTFGTGGTPLVICHGLFGSSDNWRGIAKQLATYRQVICVDLRNHGRSFHDSQQSYSLMAEDLRELLRALNLSKIHLLGHSIGGKVAMQFAADFPDMLAKLIVVDIAPRRYRDTHSDLFKSLLAIDLSQHQQRASVDSALAGMIPDKATRQFLLTNLVLNDGRLHWRIDLENLFCHYPALLKGLDLPKHMPLTTLFIAGAYSDYITEADWQQITDCFSQTKRVKIAEAGHWVHADQPAVFCQTVSDFLNDD